MSYKNDRGFAKDKDVADKLRSFRERFYFPKIGDDEVVYFTGNSLGLQPKSVQDSVLNELEDWATFGVEGHFHARNPWMSYHEQFAAPLANIVGAKEVEVVAMNQLTVNLHLLMVSFYRPNKERYKIICEAKAFPSDQYALETQVSYHGFEPNDAIIEVAPRDGEVLIREEDIYQAIQDNKDELALVLFGGVNYYTGQLFNMERITSEAQSVGALAGFDLAHAAGNVKLELHKWGVDFACWCSYKYLNSGPGGVAGAFVHEKHLKNPNIPRFAGWWGHDKESRFKMEKGFKPIQTAEGWQLSNAPVLSMAAHKASLDIFTEVGGMEPLVTKARALTAFMEFIVNDINSKVGENKQLEIITPSDEKSRGCQLSIVAHGSGRSLFEKLSEAGVVADWREPNVIRCAPVPLYNSFEDIWRFGDILLNILKDE